MAKAFVFPELKNTVPFDQAPWRPLNPLILDRPCFSDETWLSAVANKSVGGFYEFDSIENATRLVTDNFHAETRALDVAYTTRLSDAAPVHEASGGVHSHFFS